MATLTRKRRFNPKRKQQQAEALSRAVGGLSAANYGTIYDGFTAMGIPEEFIVPRRTVLSYNAWLAVGRQVRKGEHGVKITTWVEGTREKKDGTKEGYKFSKTVAVFHLSQTDPVGTKPAPAIAGYLEYHPQTN